MPNRLLMTPGGELEAALVDRGLTVSTDGNARARLRAALAEVRSGSRVRLVDAPGWCKSGTGADSYVLIDGQAIGPSDETLVLKAAPENAAAKMSQAGSLDGWKQDVAALAAGNPVAAFSICMAFAGPLLKPLAETSGGFHFFGRSRAGKTLAMRMGLSVWGAPRKSGLLRDWRSTANALEGSAEEASDGLLCLDEIHQAEPREVVGAVYQLANESGKGRMTREAVSKRRRTWQVMVQSCGEVDIATVAAKHSNTPLPAGADIRLPSVPIDGREMWPRLHGHASAQELMSALQTGLGKHHGTAIRPFLAALVDEIGDEEGGLQEAIEAQRTALYAELPDGADPQVKEVARRCALIALAGEMAVEWGILPWPTGEATTAASTILGWWLGRRDNAGATEESQHIRTVRSYLSEFGGSRFVALNWTYEHVPAGQWVEKYPDRPVQSRTGWRRYAPDTDAAEYVIDRDGWHRICSDSGLDPVEVAKTLAAAGHLNTGEGKNLAKRVRVPGLANSIRCYVVRPSIFITAEDAGAPAREPV